MFLVLLICFLFRTLVMKLGVHGYFEKLSFDERNWSTILFLFLFFFFQLSVILSQLELSRTVTRMYPKYFNRKLRACLFYQFYFHCDPSHKAWVSKVYLWLEASYSFKNTFILVRQLIPLINTS